MSSFQLTAALVAALALNAAAFALDSTPAVKATTILKASQSWDGKPLAYPAGQAEITGMIIEIAPGAETGWHLHPVPSFGMVLEGELEVRLKNGATNRLKAGDTLAEVVDTLHNGRNVGAGTVKLAIFYAGAVGGALTVREPVAAP
ncbi:cupin domain-containing protein [Chitinimonas koreensis]|uniref:cupin domain-containing protein n=1 Tax=Chitinimonas koreensis TaxID=356302 RepID=UPI0003FF9CDB|nr:cupin domain-containing protein [Chitinimonas koreensis]QNM95549.1 cupin domain-containing protein [Chitinimonas koreensis]